MPPFFLPPASCHLTALFSLSLPDPPCSAGAVRASSIFPILSVILLFMGGLCIAASEFYKTRHNIILSAGIFFVSAGNGHSAVPARAQACQWGQGRVLSAQGLGGPGRERRGGRKRISGPWDRTDCREGCREAWGFHLRPPESSRNIPDPVP